MKGFEEEWGRYEMGRMTDADVLGSANRDNLHG